ncbi:MAG TPA: metallophosphoesterase [Bacteroidales bacterium]|nr:metallophosphoesterase [Bacteroidales bacterium]HRR51857.1 metallophosphoesterase [Bacteroidales bacterium]HRS68565.1 metallophosphoesterase [Bacteroidales bacterium]
MLKRKDDNSIIIITGDLFHTKLELSPEAIDMAGLYLTELSNILPTFVITGNHDANLSNKNRLDALTPIIELIDGKNLFYLRDTDWYNYDNLNFWVASVFDERLPL